MAMPAIDIQLEPVEVGKAEVAREVARLEAEGKQIQEIRFPGWAARDLGIVPETNMGNAGTYGRHRATQYAEPYPGQAVRIIYRD
jgi:hypothetical protein